MYILCIKSRKNKYLFNWFILQHYLYTRLLREAAKKSYFLNGSVIKDLSPPLSLMAVGTLVLIKKKILMSIPLPPPPLMALY